MKKTMFRFLCVLLVLPLLMALVPAAMATEGELILGSNYEVRFYRDEPRIWSFTPSDSGEYLLFTPSSGSLLGEILGQTPTARYSLQTGQAVQVYSLTAGTAYQIRIQLNDTYTSPYSDVFQLDKKQPLQSLTLNYTSLTGQRDNYDSIHAELYPAYYPPTGLTWTSSDPSVVSIESTEGYECYFRMNKVGTAILTAKINNLSAKCTVTVEKATGYWDNYPVWPANQKEMKCTVSPEQGYSYSYTPNQTDVYALHAQKGASVYITGTSPSHILNQRHAITMEEDYYLVDLIAGETYVIDVSAGFADGAGWRTVSAFIEKAKNAQSITLYGPNMTNGAAIEGYVGGIAERFAVADPIYSFALNGGFRYTSSNSGIANAERAVTEGANNIFLTGEGNCNITVTTGSASVVCPVKVKPSPVLEVGKTTTLTFSYQDAYGVTCLFTPQESGNFTFTVKGSGGTCYIEDTQIGNFIYGSGSMGGWLQGGRTYQVILGVGNSDHTVTVYGPGSQPPQDVTPPNQGSGDSPEEPNPSDPAEPGTPVDPSIPTEPANPSEPTQPTEPDIPQAGPEVEELADRLGGRYENGAISLNAQDGRVNIPAQELAALVQNQVDLVVKENGVSVKLDSKVLITADGQAAGDLELIVRLPQQTDLNQDQKAALETKTVAGLISLVLTCDGRDIHDFGGGQATVTLPLAADTSDATYAVYYLSPEGTMEKMENVTRGDGSLTFRTGHFSDYVIVQEPMEEETKQPNLLLPILLGVAAVVAVAVAVVLLRRKK